MVKGQKYMVVSNGREEPRKRFHHFKKGDIVTFNRENKDYEDLPLLFVSDCDDQWLAADMVVPLFETYLKEVENDI